MKNYSLNRLLVLTASAGFGFLLLDTTIEHWSILTKDVIACVPLAFCLIATIVGILTFILWKEKWIRALQILLLASFLVAGTGVYFHIHEDDDEKVTTETQAATKEKEKDKPLLAPLAFGGVAVVGLMGTARKWKSEVI
ncbi:MAG TPA: hypothetical protein VLY03_09185 [Bacteroidota bacterium]|nr:hypothetical protein [Bacteroidota bacterium]